MVDATGATAAGVKVTTRLPGRRSSEATTDARGAFRLTGVLPGEKVRVSAHTDDGSYTAGRVELPVPQLGATVDVGTIRLTDLRNSDGNLPSQSLPMP